MDDDPRRGIPATDRLLELLSAEFGGLEKLSSFARAELKTAITRAQDQARRGKIAPAQVADAALAFYESAEKSGGGMHAVLNATGVLVHTNLGRAPMSRAAVAAIDEAAGYVDVELDLETGQRSRRGEVARRALLTACPAAEDALVVNNGAGALLLAVAALGAGREVVISRGQLIEIGGGFRLPEVISAVGARLREVGTTNRTHPRDYEEALGSETGCVLQVHPSNFVVTGFTAGVPTAELAAIAAQAGVPLVSDLGSGLLYPNPRLPDEPDVTSALRAGADLVIVSGDKLLGGPQAGIILGRKEHVQKLARHPIARAVRADKLTYAALAATLRSPTPIDCYLNAAESELRERARNLATKLRAALGQREGAAAVRDGEETPGRAVAAGTHETHDRHGTQLSPQIEVVAHAGHVGGGGAPTVELPGWALKLPEKLGAESIAHRLRQGQPPVVARTHGGACLVDPRCVPPERDGELLDALIAALTLP